MAYTKDSLLELAKKVISLRNSSVDLTTGTVLSDVGVDATAQVLESISNDVDRIVGQQRLDPAYFTDEEADLLVQVYGLTRNKATKATGFITFATNTLPSVSSPIYIPAGTVVYGTADNGDTQISFTTTADAYLTSSATYNTTTGYYETVASIEAVLPGSQSNLGIGYINNLSSSISGLSAVYNKNAITNGSDIESTQDLLNRFILMWRGRNRNTEPGILAWTYTNPLVEDAVVIGPDSEYSLRGPGAVDVYVSGTTATQYVQTVTTPAREILLITGPVIDPELMYVTLDGTSYTQDDNIFVYVKDESSIYQSSSDALDKIVFTDTGYELIKNLPSFTITYYYNSVVVNLQRMFDTDEGRLITGDILARNTQQTNIIMEFGIVPETGYDKQTTINLVRTNIQNYVNTLPMNTSIRQSDIVAIIEGTDGVSYTELPFLQFHKYNEDDENKWVADIDATPLSYFRVSAEDIIIG